MRDRGRGGNGGRDWGSIDWSNIDLSNFGRGTRVRGPSRRAVALVILLVAILLFPLFISPLVAFVTDLLWFRSLGLEDVYLRRYTAAFWAFVAFFLIFFVIALPHPYFALRPQVPRVVVDVHRRRRGGARGLTLRRRRRLLILSLVYGLRGSTHLDASLCA